MTSIFIGGGTPSLFSPEAIDRLLVAIRARLALAPALEVTLEANPGTFERETLRRLPRPPGSIGCRSASRASMTGCSPRSAGFTMPARPGPQRPARRLCSTLQSRPDVRAAGADVAGLQADLATALSFAPAHLSVYHLTLEPNTLFAPFPPPLPDDDLAAEMQDADRGRARCGRPFALRGLGLRAGRPALRDTTSTTGTSATTSASAPGRTASCRLTTASSARCAGSTRRAISKRRSRATRLEQEHEVAVGDLRSSSC